MKSKIPAHLEKKIIEAFAKYGIIVKKFDALPDNPFYRPLAKLASEGEDKYDNSIWCIASRLEDGTFIISAQSYDGKIESRININIDNPDAGLTPAQRAELADATRERYIALEEDSLNEAKEKFADLDKIERGTTSKVCDRKCITIPSTGDAFIAKKITVNGREMQDVVVVPFSCDIDHRPCGVQVRIPEGGSRTMKGSKFKNAISLVQVGKPIFGLMDYKVVFLSESYTTGATIANARPDDYVYCCAGIHHMESVYERLQDIYKDSAVIIPVLDKTKNGKYCPKQANLEGFFNEHGVDFIQLPTDDESLSQMTDFNDYRIKFGAIKLGRLLDKLLMHAYPHKPEVVGEDELHFQYIMPWANEPVSEKKSKLLDSDVVPANYLDALCRAKNFVRPESKIEDKKKLILRQDGLIKLFSKEARDKNRALPRGIGIYKEGDQFLANLKPGRWIVGDEIKATSLSKPLSSHFYMNVAENGGFDLENVEFTKDTLKSLSEAWKGVYDSSQHYFEPLLGLCVQAAYAAFSRHRTHAWITGSSGTGKSAIIKNFVVPAFNFMVQRTNDATAAGVDTKVNAMGIMTSSPFIVLDEQRANNQRRVDRVKELIMIARDASNIDEGAAAWRSNADQQSKTYARRFSALFCSTQSILNDKQDISRFLLFHLEDEGVGGRMKQLDNLRKVATEKSPELLKGILQAAKYYEEAEKAVKEQLIESIKGQEASLSHKPSTLAPIFASITALERVYRKVDILSIAKEVLDRHSDFILAQYRAQDEQFELTSTTYKKFVRTMVVDNGITVPFKKYMEDMDEEQADAFYHSWGMIMGKKKGAGTLYIPANKISIAAEFFRSSYVKDKFRFDKDNMDDLVKQSKQHVSKGQSIIKGKTQTFYRIKLRASDE